MIRYYVAPGLRFREKIVRKMGIGKTMHQKMDLITEHVCHVLGIDKEVIFTKNRKQEYVFARQVSMYFIHSNYREISLKSIGNYFAGRDHTTVIHSIQRLKDLIETEDQTRYIIKMIEERL